MKNYIDRKEYFGTLKYDIKNHKVSLEHYKEYLDNVNNRSEKHCLSAPINIFLELTKKCNLNCLHCFNGVHQVEDILDVEIWKGIIDQLTGLKVFFVKITGGEPFLYPQLFELLHHLELKHMNYIIYTNGFYIKENIEKLKKLKHLIMLRVSLDGNRKYNDIIRGKGNFDEIITVLKILDLHNIKYSINYTVNRLNYKMLPELEQYVCYECNLNAKIHLGFIKYAGNSLNNKELCFKNDNYFKDALGFIEKIIKSSRIIEPLYMLPEYYYYLCGNHFGCPAGQTSMVIKSNGCVIPCGLMSDYENAQCGDVRVDKIIDIWNNERMNYFRNLECSEKCQKCEEYKKNCTGGCRANALNVFGDIHNQDVNCFIYKTNFSREKRITIIK